MSHVPPPYWDVPKMWRNQTVFILGGGPSLERTPLDLIHDFNIIGVNNAYKLGSWVDICWFGDLGWWRRHKNDLSDFQGVTAHCNESTELLRERGVKHLRRLKTSGIDTTPGCAAWNGCSGSSALNLAYHLGASCIVLLGFDMHAEGKRKNWHDDHISHIKSSDAGWKEYTSDMYAGFRKHYPRIASDAVRLKIEIINCTPGSSIREFPFMDLNEFLTFKRM